MLTIESHRGVARRTACTLCLCVSFTVSLPATSANREISLQDAVRLAVDRAPMLDARRAGHERAVQQFLQVVYDAGFIELALPIPAPSMIRPTHPFAAWPTSGCGASRKLPRNPLPSRRDPRTRRSSC